MDRSILTYLTNKWDGMVKKASFGMCYGFSVTPFLLWILVTFLRDIYCAIKITGKARERDPYWVVKQHVMSIVLLVVVVVVRTVVVITEPLLLTITIISLQRLKEDSEYFQWNTIFQTIHRWSGPKSLQIKCETPTRSNILPHSLVFQTTED